MCNTWRLKYKSYKDFTMYAKSFFTFAIFSLVVTFCTSCNSDKELSLEEKLQNVLDSGIDEFNAKGVSAAIIFSEDKKWIGTSGISYDTVSVKPDMLFAIGSVTKNIVAALALSLVEEGKLSLDDPLSKWLPDYPHVNNTITIRQLLNHTSGIYMFWSNQKIWDDLKKDRNKIWTPEEVLTYIKEPYFEPGKGKRYSNTNYLLMAMIITKATASSLSIELKERFWNTLGIKNAYLSIEEEIPENQIHVFGNNFNNDSSYFDLTFLPRNSHESITYGSSGLFMTAEDLAYWCYSLYEGKVLNEQSIATMIEDGLGVGRYKKMGSGEKVIGHAGANIGTSAYMLYLPDQHFSVVVMMNKFKHQDTQAIAKKLIAVVLREMDVIGIIPHFDYRFVIIVAIIFWSVFAMKRRRRKMNLKIEDKTV